MYAQGMATAQDTRPLALLYVRVSTTDQVEGASLEAQAHELTEAAERRGYRVEVIREEGRSGKSLAGRPALTEALARLRSGQAQALITKRLDRLTRSVADFASLLDRAKRQGWHLVILDADVDTSTPAGEFLVNVLASAAQYERRLIGARTRDALAQRKREGVRLGRPVVMLDQVRERIRSERDAGRSLRAIAQGLNADQVPTAHQGSQWHASTVAKALQCA